MRPPCSAALLAVLTALLAFGSFPVSSDEAPYYGKQVGPLSRLAHGVSGVVYVVDAHRIRVRDLTYDGTAPAAFFWIGLKGAAGDLPDDRGVATPDENGRFVRLQKYSRADVTLTLKQGVSVTDLKWFSLWCKMFEVNFGHVLIPTDFVPPKPTVIGQFTAQSTSDVQSGPITVLDHKTILIEHFTYSGKDQDVYVVAGSGSGPNVTESLTKIPRADRGLDPLRPGTLHDVDLVLTFPPGLTVFNVDFLAVYSPSARTNHAQVGVARGLDVPPYIDDKKLAAL